jgi:alanyl-tRNA synthetase
VCELPEGTVSIPCGGTHVRALTELDAVMVTLTTMPVDGGVELEMRTRVAPSR